MSQRRCPNCGGLVGVDAEWCTQCFARLEEPAPERPSAEQAPAGDESPAQPGEGAPAGTSGATRTPRSATGTAGPVKVRGEVIVWECSACGTENPIELKVCSACGTPFGQVFQEPEQSKEVDPGRAATFSLLFPGAGHVVAGRPGEAFARAIIFAFALIMGLASIGPVRAGSGGMYLLLMVVSLGAAAALYVLSTADAGRAARGEEQILSMRFLLYGAVGLIFIAILVLTIAATQARG